MSEIRETTCCGMGELGGISYQSVEQTLINTHKQMTEIGHPYYAFLVFTDITETRNGQNLRDYIKKNNLGEVIESSSRLNNNSGNRIKAYIWSPNWTNYGAWYKRNRK